MNLSFTTRLDALIAPHPVSESNTLLILFIVNLDIFLSFRYRHLLWLFNLRVYHPFNPNTETSLLTTALANVLHPDGFYN